MVRLAICTGWFMVIFGANYLVVGPFFNKVNHAIEPPTLSAV